ncbi:reverse transcriptase domain, reverse transcriptase zinc-binding domain protein, partial [Tanacetum coccineum]
MADGVWQEVSYKKRRSVFDRLGFSAKNMLTVYVSNFPSHLSVRELSNICGKKGSIVDVYIAKHKNKFGQMFGFCRFSGIDDKESLIDSLKDIWIGKLRLHANIARFVKNVRSEELKHPQDDVKKQYSNVPLSGGRGVNSSRSFLNVTKGVPAKEKTASGNIQVEELSSDLLSQEVNSELELAVLGCHKDFRTIANSKIICRNEGFIGVDVKYLGGLWVLFTLQDKKARDCFLNHEGVLSWFSSLKLWHNDFNVQERLVWLEIEGVPVRAWYDDTFKSVCKKWGEVMFIDNSDLSNRFTIRVCVKSSHQLLIFATTNITLNGVSYFFRVRELCSWTPTFAPECEDSDKEDSLGNANKAASEQNEDEDLESIGDFNNIDDNEVLFNIEEEEKLEQPPNSDPFELESLIAKRGKLNANKKNSDTPKYPPGFTQSDNGEDKHDNSGINKPVSPQMQSSNRVEAEIPKKYFGMSMIQQVEDTIKVGKA